METWLIGFGANAIIALAYFAISATILFGVARSKQWRTNPLALATGMIFLTCGAGHFVHAFHAFDPFAPASVSAQRFLLGDWHVWVVDGVTALVAVWYFTLRGRFPALVRGAALFEDMRVRQRQALEIHDNIVQGIVKAKLSLELGEANASRRELDETLVASRKIMSDLLGEAGKTRGIRPGELVRKMPHGGPP